MNEFALYAMQAPPLKRPTRQRFTEFYNSEPHPEERDKIKGWDSVFTTGAFPLVYCSDPGAQFKISCNEYEELSVEHEANLFSLLKWSNDLEA